MISGTDRLRYARLTVAFAGHYRTPSQKTQIWLTSIWSTGTSPTMPSSSRRLRLLSVIVSAASCRRSRSAMRLAISADSRGASLAGITAAAAVKRGRAMNRLARSETGSGLQGLDEVEGVLRP